MARVLFILIFGLFHQGIFGQTVKILEYTVTQEAKSEKELEEYKQSTLKYMGSSESSELFNKAFFAKKLLHTLYFHQDSSLVLYDVDGEFSPSVGFRFGQSGGSINLNNGEIFYVNPRLIQKTVDKTFGKGKITIENGPSKDEISKRLSRKEMIDQYECETWEVLDPRYQSETKYWLWKEKTNFDLSINTLYSLQGKLIVKSVHHSTQAWDQTITRSLVRIDSIQNYSIQRKLDELFAQHAGEMVRYYADLPGNQFDDSLKIGIGTTLPAFNIRDIETDRVTNLDSILKHSRFLLIDMWASWCGPCIKSFPELQKLKNDYGSGLQILSLNYGDKSFSKIQNVLDKQEPNWPQAYSSHRIYRLINKEHAYPTMLLIDQNRKIVLQGQPDLSFIAIRNFLDENLK